MKQYSVTLKSGGTIWVYASDCFIRSSGYYDYISFYNSHEQIICSLLRGMVDDIQYHPFLSEPKYIYINGTFAERLG